MILFFRRLKEKLSPKSATPPSKAIHRLEQALGYRFKSPEFLHLALVHRSYLTISGGKQFETNERLEFLGDAVLGMHITEYLYRLYPRKSEGVLTKYKSALVSRKTLGKLGKQLELGNYIYFGQGEERSGGKHRESILSDAFESVTGAVFLDGGHPAVKKILEKLVLPQVDDILSRELYKNYKSQLLEYSQANGMGIPKYETQVESGPEHDKMFEVGVILKGEMFGVGKGKSKKKAEQQAAKKALDTLLVD